MHPQVNQTAKVGFFIAVSAIALASCTKTLDTSPIETNIQESIARQGGTSVKSVTCPKNILPEPEKTFACIGELDSGDTFAIAVKQVDDQGKVSWQVANAKGLLNLNQLETVFQQTLKQTDPAFAINCGDGYRSVKPTDQFECQVSHLVKEQPNAPKKGGEKQPAKKVPEKIVVTIDAQGNVNWQQVFLAPASLTTAQAPSGEAESPSSNLTTSDSNVQNSTPSQPGEARGKLSAETLKDLEQRVD